MKRREFMKTALAGATGAALGRFLPGQGFPGPPPRQGAFLLSTTGCGRATGYAETNKIVTFGSKTHVAWLDSTSEGFRVRIRTLDNPTGEWSPAYTVGEAFDNHGGPALTVDSKGYLHIVYYPHHHPFRYRRSARPNDASQWEEEIRFGRRCTYPTLLCGPDNTLYLTCRESVENPWVVNLYTKRPESDRWEGPRTILRALKTGYAHFQEALAWGTDRRTIHLSCRFYDGNPGVGHTVGYLRSRDLGLSWERSDGARVALPATAQTVEVLAGGADRSQTGWRCGAIAVDRAGRPYVLYSTTATRPFRSWIARLEGPGAWSKRPLLGEIEKHHSGWGACMPGGVTFDTGGRMFITLTLKKTSARSDEEIWGHPSSEVILLESPDGGKSFASRLVSKPDPNEAHWLPNIERPTGWNAVARPGLIYTAGPPGSNNRQRVSNKVWWFR